MRFLFNLIKNTIKNIVLRKEFKEWDYIDNEHSLQKKNRNINKIDAKANGISTTESKEYKSMYNYGCIKKIMDIS